MVLQTTYSFMELLWGTNLLHILGQLSAVSTQKVVAPVSVFATRLSLLSVLLVPVTFSQVPKDTIHVFWYVPLSLICVKFFIFSYK